jgi:hypothetical protein
LAGFEKGLRDTCNSASDKPHLPNKVDKVFGYFFLVDRLGVFQLPPINSLGHGLIEGVSGAISSVAKHA